MTLTDEQLDALAERLRVAWNDSIFDQKPYGWAEVARAAARWAEEQNRGTLSSLAFYQKRCRMLHACQSQMRDPERTLVCDILANGQLIGPLDHPRYTAAPTPVAAEQQGEVVWEAGRDGSSCGVEVEGEWFTVEDKAGSITLPTNGRAIRVIATTTKEQTE